MRDLYVNHIFIARDYDRYSLSFIDLENMSQNVRSSYQKARDLGRLYYSMADEYFDEDSKELLIDTYLSDEGPNKKAFLKRMIIARAEKMAKRRKLAEYRP